MVCQTPDGLTANCTSSTQVSSPQCLQLPAWALRVCTTITLPFSQPGPTLLPQPPSVTQMCQTLQVLRAHILPLTNCAFNKAGDRFITGSYDRTCKVRVPHTGLLGCVGRRGGGRAGRHGCEGCCQHWHNACRGSQARAPGVWACLDQLAALCGSQVWDTYTGEDMFTLEGHKNVVGVGLLQWGLRLCWSEHAQPPLKAVATRCLAEACLAGVRADCLVWRAGGK